MRRPGLLIGMIFLLVTAGTLPSCETGNEERIPYVKVDEYLLLYADLADMGVGSTKLIKGGWKGIILYRAEDLEFYAYDRTCTRYPEHDRAVTEDPDFVGVFECPVCGSTFLIMNGAEPNSGPARHPLLRYQTSIEGDLLHVYN